MLFILLPGCVVGTLTPHCLRRIRNNGGGWASGYQQRQTTTAIGGLRAYTNCSKAAYQQRRAVSFGIPTAAKTGVRIKKPLRLQRLNNYSFLLFVNP